MKLHLPLKLRAALLALCLAGAPSAFSFYDTIFKFEGSTDSETGTGLYTVAGTTVSGTETYIDSGLVVGSAIGNYKLTRDLGKAFSFNDATRISISDDYWKDGVSPSSSFTLAAYVNFTSISGVNALFGTGVNGDSGFSFSVVDGKLRVTTKKQYDYTLGMPALKANTWYAVAVSCSYDETAAKNYASFYVDGAPVGNVEVGTAFNTPGTDGGAAIGSNSSGANNDLLNGAIAEFQILSGAKSQEEIKALFGLETVNNLWWRGTATEKAWDTSSKRWSKDQATTDANAVFSAGDLVHFGTEGGTVTIDENIVAREMIVAGTYSFNVGADKKLTTGALTISDGATATLGGSGFTSITGDVDSVGDTKSGILKIDGGTVIVTGAINSALEVTGGELTANLITSAAEIKAGSLAVNTVSGNLTVSGGTTTITGGNNAFSGSTLLVSGGAVEFIYTPGDKKSCISSGATVNVTEGGTLKLTGHDMLGWEGVSPEKIILKGKTDAGNQAILDIEDTGSCTFTPTIVMNGYSELTGTKFNSYNEGSDNLIEASGIGNIVSIELDVRREARLNVAEKGELTISGIIANGADSAGQLVKTGTGTLIVTSSAADTRNFSRGTRIEGGTLLLRDGGTLGKGSIDMSSGTVLQVEGNTELINTITGSGSLLVTNGGYLQLSGNVNATPITVNENSTLGLSAAFTSGGMITFENNAAYKGATISGINRLSIDQTLTVVSTSLLTSDGTTKYMDRGEESNDGYAVATYVLAEGTIALATGAKANVGGNYYTLNLGGNNDKLTFTTDGKSGDFCINTANKTVNYDRIDTTSSDIASDKTSTVVLNATGVTLNMKTSLNPKAIGGIKVAENATVNLAEKSVVLKKTELSVDSGKTLTLAGQGIYDLGFESSIGDRISFATGENGWTGTVTISNAFLGGPVNWNKYVNGTFSTLQLTSVSGWINPNSTVAANLRLLEDTDGAPGFTITGVNNNVSYSFSGKISGDGDLAMKQADRADRSATFNLQGDCSEWTGNFLLSEMGSGTATVNYTGSPTIGNGFINDSAATMNVNLSKDGDAVVVKGIIDRKGEGDLNLSLTGSSSKTFKKSVNATGITISGGAAEFSDRVTATTLTANTTTTLSGAGNVIDTLEGTGKMLVSGGTTEVTNALAGGTAVEVTGGTLSLAGGTAAGSGLVTVKDGGTLSLKGETSFANNTVTLEKNGVLTCSGDSVLKGTVGGSGTLKVASGSKLQISGNVTLGASIENSGTLVLDANNGGSLTFTSRDVLEKSSDVKYNDSKTRYSGNGYSSGSYFIVKPTTSSGVETKEIKTVRIAKENKTVEVNKDTDKEGAIYISDKDAEDLGGLYYITLGGQLVLDDDGKTVRTDPFVYDLYSTDNLAAHKNTTGLVICAQKSVSVVVPNPTPDAPDATTTTEQKVLDEDKVTTLVLMNSLNESAVEGIIVQSKTILLLDGNSTTDAAGAVTYSIELDKATIDPTKDAAGNVTFTPTLTLTGKGLYKMDKATGLDADATKVGTGWSGAVQVTNTELGGNGDDKFYITALNNLGGNIEISGLSGYACGFIETTDAKSGEKITTVSKDPTVTAALKLSGTALTLTDAPDKNLTGGTLTLRGKLSGSGSIVNNSTGNVSLGGNISGWTGSYTASEASSVLTLAAGAELNASVTGGSVTLEGALTLGKTMSLSGNLTGAGSITLKGDALDAAKTAITVAGSVTGSGTGTLAFTIGTDSLSFLSGLADGGEFVLLSAKGGITGYSGATLNDATVIDADKVRYYVETSQNAVTLSKVTLGLQWEGTTEDGGWTTTTGFGQKEGSPLTNESVVSFTGGGSATVDVKDNQVVKGINVDAYGSVAVTEYTFTGDSLTTDTLGIVHGNLVVQNNLTVNELTSIHTGTTLTVSEGGSLTGGGMSNNGTLSIGEGSVVTVNTLTGVGKVSGDGKLVVKSGTVSASTLGSNTGTIEMDSLNDSDAPTVGGTLLVRQSGSYAGAYKEKTSIGTTNASATQILRADANLTVIGKAGTVSLTGLNNTDATDNKLGGIDTKGETVLLNNVRDNVAADGTTTTKVPTTVTLGSASSMKGGVLDFTVSAAAVNDSLTSNDKPVVTTGAALSLKDVTLKVHEVQNKDLGITTGGQEKDIVLFVVNDTANDCKVDNVTVNMDDCPWMTKYFTNFRVVEGSVNVIGDANTSYYSVHGQTPNGTAGLALAGKAMFHLDPQTQNPDGELAQVLDMLDAHIESGNKGAMDKLGAALSGSSLSAVGLALADDVQRQLRSIRNRTTTMGVNECVVNEDMPYVNGWISGDGNYRQLSESGTDAGYQLSSWGGTVGVDVDVNPNLTLGVAVSALFGDYTGKAADTLTGDLDTQYVSLFARVSTGSWVNTFVGTLGRADVDLERTLPGIAGKTTYKTDGMMFGFLYEVARTFALNEDASTCVQPLFNMSFSHTSLDSATEGGTADTRLTTDSASLTQFSLGLGGRIQSVVGENEYNRASIFEARALLKLDLGDRYSKLNTTLAALPTATVTTRSNEKGVIGAEVGASLTIPISQDAGSVFFDVNADFNADQTGVNGSVGYRINF